MKLSKQQETVITWAAIIAGLGLTSYVVYEVFFKKSTIQSDLASLKAHGIVPTITDSNAEAYAEQLDVVIDSIFPSTSSLLSIFGAMNNLADLLLVISKYGTKLHFSFSYFRSFTLPEFMQQRLSQSTLNEINSLLSSKNINYKF